MPRKTSFSVIVVSRHRAEWLKRTLRSLRQQQYQPFEVVVVADEASLEALDRDCLKTVVFDQANIACARNLGIAVAAGDVCAFIDDDAAAEPLWLHRLAEAFDETDADAVVGFVRGRNGISYQSRVSSVDAEGESHVEPSSLEAPAIPQVLAGRAIKLVGTNMAIRKAVLEALSGFDETYRFFLEDADISMRLAAQGKCIAVAPLAEVHHGFAPSVRRTRQRAPLDLFDIGRSTAYFLRKHAGGASDALWQRLERREKSRMLKHMISGTCEPRDLLRRFEELRNGWADGLRVNCPTTKTGFQQDLKFKNFEPASGQHRVFSSRWLSRRRALLALANDAVERGDLASVFSFSLTPGRHHVRYTASGVWHQKGGIFGRSDRDMRAFRWCTFAERVDQETRRVAKVRGIGKGARSNRWDHSR
ncbi:MAG: glycosyltransferase family A protein [Pseudomonadota bacterium]